jgi:hypothetical protein
MISDRLQTQRFELKYRVPESTARAVREFVRCHLAPDPFAADPCAPSYPVHSLYLDSDGLELLQSTINGDRNRFKLRVRFYAGAPESPVYLEIKRRIDRCIHKQRAQVRRECVAALLEGEPPGLSHLAKTDGRHFTALRNFCALQRRLGAGPRAHVAYDREAWVNPTDNAVRVTMDRHVQCELQRSAALSATFTAPVTVFAGEVVLELKFTNRFPAWFRHLVEAHNLTLDSAAKYVDGVAAIGPREFAPVPWPATLRRSAPTFMPSLHSA